MAKKRIFSDDDLADIFSAASEGQVDLLEAAISDGYDAKSDLWIGTSVVSYAVRGGETALTRVFEVIKTVDIPEVPSYTPLFNSAMCGNLDEVIALLKLGATVEYTNPNGENVFHWAARSVVSWEVVQILAPHVTLHALLTHCLTDYTPITEAAEMEHRDLLVLLCERYMALGGSLDVRVGRNKKSMRYYVDLASSWKHKS